MVSKYREKLQQRHAPKKPSSPRLCSACGFKVRGSVKLHEAGSHHALKHPGKRP